MIKRVAALLLCVSVAACGGGSYVQTSFTTIGPGYKQNQDGTFEVAVIYGAAKSNYAPGMGQDAAGNDGVVRFKGPCGEETPPAVAMPTDVTLEASKLGVSEGIFLGSAANNMTASAMIHERAQMAGLEQWDAWPSYQYDCTKTDMDDNNHRARPGNLPLAGQVVPAVE
jgi:hypothetical protein